METKSSASASRSDEWRVASGEEGRSASLVTRHSSLHSAWAILLKDLRAECRTRTAVNAVVLFAVTTVTVISFSIASQLNNDAQAALLWVVIFFSAMSGLSRAFVHEEEGRTADALRLSASAEAVYLGKCAFNLALLLALEILIVPLFIAFLSVKVSNLPLLLAVLFLGNIGLVAVSTILAAMVAQARTTGGALFAVISLPVLLPLLGIAVKVTTFALKGAGQLAVENVGRTQLSLLGALAAFVVIFVTASLLLFEYVWKE
jgi:heme exporter protein B